MFLMFELNRPDVWPTGDLGVRAGYGRIHGLARRRPAAELEALGDAYRPSAPWPPGTAGGRSTPEGGHAVHR